MKVQTLNSVTSIFIFSLLASSFQSGVARWAQGPESIAPVPSPQQRPHWAPGPDSTAPVPKPRSPHWAQKGLQGCFISFYENSPGCLLGLFSSFVKAHTSLGPHCCEVIYNMSDTCWTLFFSSKPKLHPFIKAQCDPFLGGSQYKDI
ncbi:unnamed protein product [Amaranthus hypochondriacus]